MGKNRRHRFDITMVEKESQNDSQNDSKSETENPPKPPS